MRAATSDADTDANTDAETLDDLIRDGADIIEMLSRGHTFGDIKGFSKEALDALYMLGHNFYSQGKYEESAKVFGFLVMHDHLNQKFYKALGASFQMLKRYEDALKFYGMASLFDLDDLQTIFNMGECFLLSQRIDEAEEMFVYVQESTKGNKRNVALAKRTEEIVRLIKAQKAAQKVVQKAARKAAPKAAQKASGG